MQVLTDFTVSKTNFTWDSGDANYSTNGEFDPAKLKVGTGSCRLDVTTTKVSTDVKQLAHAAEPVEVLEQLYIVGPGEPEV